MTGSVLHIAIDFGTSYSGYAFSFQTKQAQEQIRIPSWGKECGQKTLKTPTCILFDEDQKFLKFGYDALMTYTRSTKKLEARKQYLFEHFKMELYDKELHQDLMITAKNGAQMKAMTVFSESLRFLKDHALSKIAENTSGKKFIASDATWVLTVPAIWKAAAKQFMREAATEAGLVTESDPERLLIALEPEAASVFSVMRKFAEVQWVSGEDAGMYIEVKSEAIRKYDDTKMDDNGYPQTDYSAAVEWQKGKKPKHGWPMYMASIKFVSRAMLQKWPHVVHSSTGAAINAKLTEIRGKKKQKNIQKP
ncbi:heat shock 70 kDa 12A-like protein [Labeo rohita]|uniref:Heat shock 70 kDa 12A-like protein n=1 Tax=Labeo rohita TaxID=84645 RepID=A0A498M5V9_LABRO|nr:heat shock 70 kDa 12A-like protein [Labeo rohita]RXN39328.1 heat shock 70 kDa 12A-like protein [Labeo rohita]